MYILPDIEKDRLRAELEYRMAISKELEPKGMLKRISSFFSHAFVITVAGGVALSCISSSLQNSYALSQQKLQHLYEISKQNSQYQKQLRDNKISVYSNFAEKFEQGFNILLNIHIERIRINNLSKKIEACTSPRNKQRLKEAKELDTKLYNKVVDEDIKNHHIISAIYSVQAVFRNINVHTSAENLEKQVAHMNTSDKLSENDYNEIGKSVYLNFKDLLKYMDDEINEPLTSSEKLPK